MANNRLDVVIFGASGFTGKWTVYEATKLLDGLTWGVAGRDGTKLRAILKEMGDKANKDLSDIPIIIADVKDVNSLNRMAEKAKIIVNCCGPYRFYGEPVIKACLNAGTHHVDVSGEPAFLDRMQLEYNDMAREKGVYIVGACGFDSIPAEMGVQFVEKNFDGEIHSIETYLEFGSEGKHRGAGINYGTWETLIHSISNAKELSAVRKKLFKEPLPFSKPRQVKRSFIHKSEIVNSWCVPFMGADRSVLLRSQKALYELEHKRPAQIQTYYQLPSFFWVIVFTLFGAMLGLMASFKFGRDLLLKHPKFFSFGFVSRDGPSEEMMRDSTFSIIFYAIGWPKEESLLEITDQHTTPPTKTLMARVKAKNPGYGATVIACLLSATTILNETHKLPENGGVLPPGACFAKTNLISNLCKNGFTFEIIPN